MRGNLLDLEHVWKAANSLRDAFELPSAHLNLSWHEGLPYWGGLTTDDLANIAQFSQAVGELLTAQETKLAWDTNLAHKLVPTPLQSCNASYYPAFTLVKLPRGLKVRRPRYDHSHTTKAKADPTMEMAHPPVKVQWPRGGRSSLAKFVVEALLAENILAWRTSQLDTEQHQALAVATAPWFNSPGSYEGGPIKHVAAALCKVDFWLFNR